MSEEGTLRLSVAGTLEDLRSDLVGLMIRPAF